MTERLEVVFPALARWDAITKPTNQPTNQPVSWLKVTNWEKRLYVRVLRSVQALLQTKRITGLWHVQSVRRTTTLFTPTDFPSRLKVLDMVMLGTYTTLCPSEWGEEGGVLGRMDAWSLNQEVPQLVASDRWRAPPPPPHLSSQTLPMMATLFDGRGVRVFTRILIIHCHLPYNWGKQLIPSARVLEKCRRRSVDFPALLQAASIGLLLPVASLYGLKRLRTVFSQQNSPIICWTRGFPYQLCLNRSQRLVFRCVQQKCDAYGFTLASRPYK